MCQSKLDSSTGVATVTQGARLMFNERFRALVQVTVPLTLSRDDLKGALGRIPSVKYVQRVKRVVVWKGHSCSISPPWLKGYNNLPRQAVICLWLAGGGLFCSNARPAVLHSITLATIQGQQRVCPLPTRNSLYSQMVKNPTTSSPGWYISNLLRNEHLEPS